ncbi:cellulose synthase catalytic subunit [Vulcanococcus sp. Clear-D1]|uniref:glycosyltransferase family 2 protein n=1 Tax=Vulcanococcus sp. Clear-D1 TaxID=2766970 RepID=UPI0019AD8C94|nr:cellulose synthase catalytic subunit [Vulcanococcus sp. Clear-D1]MBD1192950.1 glycosyltransferase [Vulcanococcus sp. Clear-D1]
MTAELWLPWLVLLWPLWLSRRPEARCPLWMRRSLLLLLALLSLSYLHWRLTASLNLSGPLAAALSVLLLLAESWLLLSGLLPLLLAWRRFSDGRPEADAAQVQWQASSWRPTVDVLIPSCGEPLPVLERCLRACSQLSYPHKQLWVLDDAGRTEVAELAARYGAGYQHRPQRRHAKAGNLNAGLPLGSGELVAVFDADFVPQQHFLERTIGLLLDPQVALVQTPQHFFNADPVMRNLAMEAWLLPDEESFYRWIEPVRSAWDAVVCAGTSFLVRRAALDDIGGFVEQAISEDLVTGMALASRGWKLRYLGEKLSAGLAAETMLDFVRQRQRWASGTLQALRLRQGPLRLRNLRPGQRLAYLEGALHWFNTVPRLLLLLMPLSIGLLGVLPVLLTDAAVLGKLLPLWIALLLSTGWLNRGSRHALLADLPGWALAVPLAATVLASLWGRVQAFRITPKHRVQGRGGIAPVLALPLLVLLGLNGLNLALILRHLSSGGGSAGGWLGLAWGGLTLLGLLVALQACRDPAAGDPSPWLALNLQASLRGLDHAGHPVEQLVTIEALSETGVALAPGTLPPEGIAEWLELRISNVPGLPALPLAPQVHRGSHLSWAWEQAPAVVREQFLGWLYGRPGAWPQRQAPPEWRALLALLRRLVSPGREQQRLSLVPQQLERHQAPDTPDW